MTDHEQPGGAPPGDPVANGLRRRPAGVGADWIEEALDQGDAARGTGVHHLANYRLRLLLHCGGVQWISALRASKGDVPS